jgi:moderate conductance mechanosensitive channel
VHSGQPSARNILTRSAAKRVLALLLFLFVPGTVWAASPPAAATTAAPPTAAPSVNELERLVTTLQDDNARAALIAQLQTLIAAERAVAKPAEPQDLLAEISQNVTALSGEVLAGLNMIVDAPMLVAWSRSQVTDPAKRARWIEVALAFGICFGLALVAEWLVRRSFIRLLPRIQAIHREGRLASLLLTAVGVIVETLPIVAFAIVASIAVTMTLPPFSMARYGLAVLVEATIEARLILTIANAVLVPAYGGASLVPASEETRNYLLIWLRRFTCWAVFGYAVAAAGWWLGIPGGIYALILKIVSLVLMILAIVFVLQNRAVVTRWIQGGKAGIDGVDGPAPRLRGIGWSPLRRRFGETWHILAIVYIVGIYLAYALRIEGGSAFILRATVVSLVVIGGARLLVRFVERLSARGFAVAPDLKTRFPLLEQRANRYLPVVTGLTSAAIYALALLLILQAWNVGSFAWFQTSLGRRLSGAVLSIGLVLVIALAAWEILAATIERPLAALDASAAPNRDRRRTLLPLLRTAILCVIIAIAALIILSQIGINTGPLLAGAGVIGLAIGFGSQALVKDIITGLFILVEDQIAVGDIVDVGKEHAGVVEAITIRTIRLRDQAGTVHTVPFSDITAVKNLTKDFSYAVAKIGIAHGEDIDRVAEILRGACDELMTDEQIAPFILDPCDYQGVDSLDEFAVVLLLRVRTLPGKQFAVGRALRRLISIALDKHGIAGRDPSPMVITGLASAAVAGSEIEVGGNQIAAVAAQRRSA